MRTPFGRGKNQNKDSQNALDRELDAALSSAVPKQNSKDREAKEELPFSAVPSVFLVNVATTAGKVLIFGALFVFLTTLPYIVLNYGGPLQINERISLAASTFSNSTAILTIGGMLLMSLPILFRLREGKLTTVERVVFSIVIFISAMAVISNVWGFLYAMPDPFVLKNWRFTIVKGFTNLPIIVSYVGTRSVGISAIFFYTATFLLGQSIIRLKGKEPRGEGKKTVHSK